MRTREMKWHVFDDQYGVLAENQTQTAAENSAKHLLKRLPIGASVLIAYTKGEFTLSKPLYVHERRTKLNNYVAW